MRIAIALVLFAHGLAHLVGFAGSWQLSAKIPFDTKVFAGRTDVGVAGARVLGVIWLILAALFAVTATAAITRAPWWPTLAVGVSIASLVMCLVELPETRIGVAVNLALLVALALALRAGTLP